MTREEWIDRIEDMSDLANFCWENNYEEYMEDIASEDSINDYIYEDIRSGDWDSWEDLRDYLSEIPVGYDWYRVNGYLNYDGLDDYDYRELKERVLNALDNDGWFDNDDDEEEEPQPGCSTEELNWDWVPVVHEDPDLEPVDLGGISGLSELTICGN